MLWDIGVYCINAARYLFRSEPEEVFAFKARGKDERFSETEEGLCAILRFPEDRLASFNVSFGAAPSGAYQLVGTQGSLRLDNAYEYKGKMTFELEVNGKKKKRTFSSRDQLAPELTYFSDCILKDREVEPSGWEGLADVRIVRALYESAGSGRPVRLEPFEKRQRPTGAQELRRPPVNPPEPVNASPPMGE